jgi:hypothetical protein
MPAAVAVGRMPVGSVGLDGAEPTKSSTVGAMPGGIDGRIGAAPMAKARCR